jgi:hypothetical protein
MASRIARIHDEYIADKFYMIGWNLYTTADFCKRNGCECLGSGSCYTGSFNHYLVRDGEAAPSSPHVFPLSLNAETVDEMSLEEIRCIKHTLQHSLQYFSQRVVMDPLVDTLVSIVLGNFKSPCFNISCYLVEMDLNYVRGDVLCIIPTEKNHGWVICHDTRIVEVLLECLCVIGICPIVSYSGVKNLDVQSSELSEEVISMSISTSGFKCPTGGAINIMGRVDNAGRFSCVNKTDTGVKAVKTALATISVVLEPTSLHGGKNPSTKKLSYVVHNVSLL